MEGSEKEVRTPLKPAKTILAWAVMCFKDEITTGSCNQKKLGVMFPRVRTISRPCREIDDLKRRLRHAQRGWSHSRLYISSDESDDDYRQRSRTSPSETFSQEEEHYRRCKRKNPSSRGLGNDAMSRALDQLVKSPFTHYIEGATLPRRFQQPTFAIYNGKTDLVVHVSQFN